MPGLILEALTNLVHVQDGGVMMTLAEAQDGAKLVVTTTLGDDVTIQAVRFGIGEGAAITIGKNIPGGPVIVVRNQMELAVGRQLAQLIEVRIA